MSINVAVALQDDQTLNMYEIAFPEGVPGGGDPLLLQYRADQQFQIPERLLATYLIERMGIAIPKTTSKEETTKEFTIPIRLDSDWKVYNDLNAWFKLCFDEVTGIYSGEADTRVPMLFRAFGPGKALKKQIKFNGCKIKGINPPPFDHTTGDPARVEASFIYAYTSDDL